MNEPLADPLVGKIVSQYEILAKLGGGGMGVVYKARDTKLGRSVALKFLPPQFSRDEDAKQRFVREAQAASATNHPNICTIHNIEQTDDGQLFIVMAHYDGETLKQRLERGPLAVDEALSIARAVAEGLAKAHAQGVVHRDIKPGNLMITEDGVRILDFGLAKLARAQEHLTMAGSTVGTIAYMSPEQARGEEADARSDIWALGVVLYEMVTGQLPFKGPYPDATFYAIKNEPPPPLRTAGRDIPESVEMLVLGALEKDPDRRFQSARDLVRALVVVQGRSIPLDFRTEPVSQPLVPTPPRVRRRLVTPARASVPGLLVVVAAVAAYLWWTWPVERIPVAVAPVANLTGYRELDAYRLALTQTLVAELSESPNIRVLPYLRLVEIIRPFLLGQADVSSREAMQALTTHSAARFLVVPTLVRENGAWRARAELQIAETATNAAVYETDPVVSSLIKDTPYDLMPALALGIQEHFKTNGPGKSYSPRPAVARIRTLDAAAAFEEGLNAYEQLEYGAARRSFRLAADTDPRNPLPHAWLSRVAQLMGQDDEALNAADQAVRLVTALTPAADVLFIEAVRAEPQDDSNTAEERYRQLVRRYPDEAIWMVELAAFLDRQTRTADAIATYHQALNLDERLVRPHLELCRLYNRLNESARAKEHAQFALSRYAELGNRGGEAQALLCLADFLRYGSDEARLEARRNAEAGLKIFEDLGHQYNRARAYNYVALTAGAQGNLAEAAALWEKAVAGARNVGNVELEALVAMNLGVTHQELGNRSRAVDYYRQSSRLYEALGREQRAAELQANAGSLLIDHGDPDEGLRDVETALAVFRKVADRNFEVSATQSVASYYRYAGRHAKAEQELNRALALARGWALDDEIASLTIDLARSRFLMSDYAAARDLLLQALGDGSGPESTDARIRLGRVHIRLGDFATAQADLSQASDDLQQRGDVGRLPLVQLAMGELAYEWGRMGEARHRFDQAAGLWTNDLPDTASVEARAYLGLLDAIEGRPDNGATSIQLSLDQAHKMGRLSLDARCRVYLARIHVQARRFDQAIGLLGDIPPGDDRMIGRELEAQVRYWRSQAMEGLGDRAGAEVERRAARQLIQDLQASLPVQYRDGFAARRDIRSLIE